MIVRTFFQRAASLTSSRRQQTLDKSIRRIVGVPIGKQRRMGGTLLDTWETQPGLDLDDHKGRINGYDGKTQVREENTVSRSSVFTCRFCQEQSHSLHKATRSKPGYVTMWAQSSAKQETQ